MNKLFTTFTAGIILCCIILHGAVAPLRSVPLDEKLFEQAISAQSPLIALFICSTLPLKIVTEYFIEQNGMQRTQDSAPRKQAADTGNVAATDVAVHEKNYSDNDRYMKRFLPFAGDLSGFSGVSAPLQALVTAGASSEVLIVLVLVCIFLLPRSSTDEHHAVLARMYTAQPDHSGWVFLLGGNVKGIHL